MPTGDDPYRTLGVPRMATQTEIRRAYRALARLHHPDVNRHDPAAERRFQKIAAAYRVLGSRRIRLEYDNRWMSGRFAPADSGVASTFRLDEGTLYHGDLGHHSDFYQAGDPLTVADAATLIARSPDWLRRAIRTGRLPAVRQGSRYLLRRRDVERLDRSTGRRGRKLP